MNSDELHGCITALAAGDRGAFEDIYNGLSIPIYTVILRITRDRTLSEDILQEVFVKLYRSPPTGTRNPRAYLFQTARNLAIDETRRQRRFADVDALDDDMADTTDFTRQTDIDDALASLAPELCEVVTLRINGGFKFREIAAMTSTPLGTVMWRYHKAISYLRSQLTGGEL